MVKVSCRNFSVDGGMCVFLPSHQQASLQQWSAYEPNFRKNYQTTYANAGLSYEQVQLAYRYGYELVQSWYLNVTCFPASQPR